MRKAIVLLLTFMLLGALALAAAEPKGPPPYLWIQYEQIQPGKHLSYLQMAQMFRDSVGQAPHYWLTGGPMVASGSDFAVVYVAFLDDFANLQRMDTDFNKVGEEMYKKNASLVNEGVSAITSARSIVAEFLPDLSMNVDKIDAAKITHWDVTTYRLRPGTRQKFAQLLNRVRDIESSRHNPSAVMVYRVVLGEPGPVYLVIRPLTSLAELDRESPAPENAVQAAVLGEQVAATVGECVVSQSEALYRVMPGLSHPPESYVAANPDFWTVKPAEAAAAPPAKKGKPTKPAAMKEKEKQ